ncbi:MAG: hypothetical protein KGD63_07415 [Candidatus Lokiarchaeota archaeon]|nr:hypothetical protein [Candidatus Lokiarchaeota archaeon]
MYYLSKKKNKYQMGATKEEIIEVFQVKGRNESIYFQELITNLSKYIETLGLYIRFNPLDDHWFISYDDEMSNLVAANPFKGQAKLAATLFCVIICTYSNSGVARVKEIKELRKKKDILDDLKILQEEGYIETDEKTNEVRLTPLIGYQLDLQKLFTKLSLKLKSNEIKPKETSN